MKVFNCAQGSDEWLKLRCGVITASELDRLVTPKFEIRKWSTEMPKTYLAEKLAETWCGPLASANAFAMEQGKWLEKEALPAYKIEFGDVRRVGFCMMTNGRVGCSPDGLVGEEGGVEIKCPEPTQHIKYLLGGTLPDDYAPQVHGSMLVTGRPWWDFMSYQRDLPSLFLRVHRDEQKIQTLQTAIGDFILRFDVSWQKLVDANGGPPVPWQIEQKAA